MLSFDLISVTWSGLQRFWWHRSLDITSLYSEPSDSQLATRIEQISLNAYSG